MTRHSFARRSGKALLAGISLLAIAAPAVAQDATAEETTGNDIVVTATKRNETIQDVPFSINAQTAADIERSGSNSLEDVARNVAGLSVQNLGPGQSQVSIRGVSAGQVVRDQPGVKEQVGVYLDESAISLSLFTPDSTCSTSTASRRCAGRRARCSARARLAARSATSPTSRGWG